MRATLATLLVTATVATGCAGSAGPTRPPPLDAAASSCGTSWEETAAWAAALEAEPTGGPGRSRFPLLRIASMVDADVAPEAFDLFVGRDRLDSEPPVTMATLDEELARVARRAERLGRTPPGVAPVAIVGIAPDVPWSRVVEIAEHLRGAGYAARFLFERARAVEPPTWSWRQLGRNLSRFGYYVAPDAWTPPSPYERPVERSVGEPLASVLAPCSDLALRAREESPAASIAAWRGYQDECRCRINQRELRAALWELHPADGSSARTVRLVGPDGAAAPVIEAPAGAPWSQVGPRIAALPSRALVRLRVTEP